MDVPDSVSIHVIFSGPCGSEPVPFHAPASPEAAGGVGAGAAGGVGAAGIEDAPPHAMLHSTSAAATAPRAADVMKLVERVTNFSNRHARDEADDRPRRGRRRRSA